MLGKFKLEFEEGVAALVEGSEIYLEPNSDNTTKVAKNQGKTHYS